ncbi:MAG: electron transfer flavoprotein subunit alpha/FixB family protein [Vulcanimicrobiota bacterium]
MSNKDYEVYNDKGDHQGVLVIAEHTGEEISSGSLQLLGKGRELADKLGVELSALILGGDKKTLKDMSGELISYGADKVFVALHEQLGEYKTLPYVRVITDTIIDKKPEIVLFTASTSGRDMAPRVAARLNTGLTADCTNLLIDDFDDPLEKKRFENILYQVRPAFGGDVLATIVSPGHYPQMATVRQNVFDVPEKDENREGKIEKIEANIQEKDMLIIVQEILRDTHKDVNLKKARIIVSGGRGLSKDPEKGFEMLKELAELLDGEVGASRGAVDRGWIDHSHQVGQTGEYVKPDLYIACGISGAVQHVAGMSGSKRIIAINKDPEATIFRYADFGIVDDAFEVLPRMIECLKKETVKM